VYQGRTFKGIFEVKQKGRIRRGRHIKMAGKCEEGSMGDEV
jgi:hypothetical protein